MRSWLILLGGPLVWTAHFFGLYGIAEFAPHIGAALVLSGACIIACLWLLQRCHRSRKAAGFSGWRRFVGMAGAGLALIAVIWQSLPILLH